MNRPTPNEIFDREAVDHLPGPVVLEFGSSTCGYCRAFEPTREKLLKEFPKVRHIWIEDGSGKPLGRSFEVKLWPTLVFLKDGHLLQKEARPSEDSARSGFTAITID